jgi:hypothetical protein
MSITPVASTQTQVLANELLQQLQSTVSNPQTHNGLSGGSGDLLTLSPAAQQLSQMPTSVTQAMGKLLSGEKVAKEDLVQLQSYLQKNPEGLSSLVSGLQGATASNSPGSKDALLTAMMNHQSNASDPRALLNLLHKTQGQDQLLTTLGDTESGSDATLFSLLG